MFLGPVRLSWAGSGPVNSPYVGTPGAAGEEGAFSLTRRNLRLEHPMQGAGACMQAPHLLCFLSTHRLWWLLSGEQREEKGRVRWGGQRGHTRETRRA